MESRKLRRTNSTNNGMADRGGMTQPGTRTGNAMTCVGSSVEGWGVTNLRSLRIKPVFHDFKFFITQLFELFISRFIVRKFLECCALQFGRDPVMIAQNNPRRR